MSTCVKFTNCLVQNWKNTLFMFLDSNITDTDSLKFGFYSDVCVCVCILCVYSIIYVQRAVSLQHKLSR